jgi:type IV secretion system protein VirD4
VHVSKDHPIEIAAGYVLLAAVGAAFLVKLSAALAGLAAGNGWTSVPLDALPSALARLPHNLSDPRGAFPAALRAQLPPAPLWYGTLALLLGATLVVGLRVARIMQRLGRPPAASWATARDVGQIVSGPKRGRIVLGRLGRRTLATEKHQSLLVVAPTQSGKTTALAVPAILEWDGPVIAASVKTDLLRDTLTHRSTVGDVAVFDPTGSTGLADRASWTPLTACETWAGARRVATSLAQGATPARRSLPDGDFWYSAAAKLLAPLLFAAASSGRTMADVVAWVDTQEEHAVVNALDATGCDEALRAMHANLMRDDRQRSSIYTTAESVLEAYADPGVLMHSGRSDIQPARLLDGGRHTIYLAAPAREQQRLRPVFVALLQELLDGAYAAAGRRGEPLDPPLLIVLDEVANIAPLPDLDVIVSTAASHGIQLVTVLQDLAQAYDRWGRDRADTLLNNHRARLFGSGTSDERTLEYLGRLLGDAEYRQRSTTSGEAPRRSVTESTAHRPLSPPHVLRESSPGTAVLVYGTLPPARLSLRPWYADRQLRRLVKTQALVQRAG